MDLISNIKCEYNLICRICLVQTENSQGLNFKMFEYCTGIDVSETPQSTQICLKCESSLNEFYIFKEKSIESHKSLIKLYSESLDDQSTEIIHQNTSFLINMFDETEKERNEKNTANLNEESSMDQYDEVEDEEDDKLNNSSSDDEEPVPKTDTKINKVIEKKEKTPLNKNKFELCMHCGNFYHPTNIKAHIRKVHMDEPILTKSHKCTQCDKSYKRKEALSKHKRVVHDKIKLYVCNLCDESFLYWKGHKNHMVYAHNAPHRFTCDICDYKTQHSQNFIYHKRQHSGELPYQCKECQKEFINARQLQLHMVTHTKEKNFICKVCNKAFGASRYLSTHMKIHTQERNYVCPVEGCGKSFIQNHVLKSHMKSTHPEVEIPPAGTIVSKKIIIKKIK